MKRWLLAIPVLLGATAMASHADYVIIRYNLAATQDPDAANNGQAAGGAQGGMAQGQGMGAMGAGLGGRGGMGQGMGQGQGMGAMGPGLGGRGGMGQGMGGMGQGQGMGAMGPGLGGRGGQGQGMGGFGQGQGMGAMGPGLGGRGGMGQGMGAMGQGQGMGAMGPGLGGRGGAGQGMGMGMGSMGQGMGMGMGGMGTLMTQPADEEEESTPYIIEIILEVEHKDIHRIKSDLRLWIKHKWGTTYFPYTAPGIDVQFITSETVAKKFDSKKSEIKEESPNKVDQTLDLAKFAMQHGMLEKVPDIMAELARLEPKHPSVIAFQKLQADMSRKIADDTASVKKWQERFGNFQPAQSDHYVLLYEKGTAQAAKVAAETAHEWLNQLEKNYANFFYWFALEGKNVPLPASRLMAVLVKDKEVFTRQQKDVFDETELVADGFFARRDNVAIFSAKPIEEGYAGLTQVANVEAYQKYPREALLKGNAKFTKVDVRNGIESVDVKCRYEMYALLFQAKEIQSELATVSHEGTRQLIAAIGLLPRNVEAPEWIDFGMASFFETPKGAYWAGGGGPNMPYLVEWKYWEKTKSKRLESNPTEALRAVITDRYFRDAKTSKKKDIDVMRARTMSWALTYFLAQMKRDGLLNYYHELAGMPRDLQFDDETLLLTFARAFGLEDVARPNQIDGAKFSALANKWYAFMKEMPVEVSGAVKARIDATKKKAQPAAPKVPPNQGGSSGPAT